MPTYPLIYKVSNPSFVKGPELDQYMRSHNHLETIFANKLSERFSDRIKTFQKVVFNYHNYYPDLVYIDRKSGVFIDIEIDEPYSRSGSPTHFIDDPRDKERNSEFINNGWNVLRFSERQIIEYLPECILIVEIFIKYYINEFPPEFDSILRKISDDRWTENESYNFQNQSLRDFYDYKFLPVQQNEISILQEFSSLDKYLRESFSRHFQNFNLEKDIIFLPYYISNIYEHKKDKHSLIYIEYFTSHRKKIINKTYTTLSGFGNPPRIKYFDFEQMELFEFIQNKIKENLRILVKEKLTDIYFYNFLQIGTMNDSREKQLKLIPNF